MSTSSIASIQVVSQRRRAADHREIGAAEVAEGVERVLPHAALADDDAHAVSAPSADG